MSPVLTFRIISVLSLVGGIILTGVTYVTLQNTGSLSQSNGTELTLGDLADRIQSEIQERADLSSLGDAPAKVDEKLNDVIRLTDGLESANLTSIIQLVRANWHKLKPFLNGAEGAALAAGLAQVVAAIVLIRTPIQGYPSKSRHYSKLWIYHYFVLGALLLVCSLLPWMFTSTSESNEIGSFLEKLKGIEVDPTKVDRSSENENSEIMRSLNMFYSIAMLDGILLLVCGTVCYCTAK